MCFVHVGRYVQLHHRSTHDDNIFNDVSHLVTSQSRNEHWLQQLEYINGYLRNILSRPGLLREQVGDMIAVIK